MSALKSNHFDTFHFSSGSQNTSNMDQIGNLIRNEIQTQVVNAQLFPVNVGMFKFCLNTRILAAIMAQLNLIRNNQENMQVNQQANQDALHALQVSHDALQRQILALQTNVNDNTVSFYFSEFSL